MSEVLRGRGVSPGIAVGRVTRVESDTVPAARETISAERVHDELERFERARETARDEIASLRERVVATLGETCAAILDVQRLILDDPTLVRDTRRRIERESVSASWALHETVTEFFRRFETIDERYFEERGSDLGEVHDRLQRLLRRQASESDAIEPGPRVVVAHGLGPGDAAALVGRGIVAIATDLGGPTSHTAIVAQALGVPAVLGLGAITARVREGQVVVVDGDAGSVDVAPDPGEIADARLRRERWVAEDAALASGRDLPTTTRDGVEIVIRANIEFAEEAPAVVRYGARGVGLYRSEFLFLASAPGLPSEDVHEATYREIAAQLDPHPLVVRSLDLGGEAYVRGVPERSEANPALGLRGVRLSLRHPEVFRPQLRGLLRAAAAADVRLMLPMVIAPEEIREVRNNLAAEAESLRAEGLACRADVPVGIMIETPAAALTADLLVREVDFIALGTNDLIQYALAVDRGDPSVADLYDPTHPAVLRAVRDVVAAGRARGVPVSLCGEMAADPRFVPILIGLGLRELSVRPRAVGPVRDAVRATDLRTAEAEASSALLRGVTPPWMRARERSPR